MGRNLYNDRNYIKELGDEPGLVQVEDSYPTKDSLKIKYQVKSNLNQIQKLYKPFIEQSDYTPSFDNFNSDFEHLKFPGLKYTVGNNNVSKQRNSIQV